MESCRTEQEIHNCVCQQSRALIVKGVPSVEEKQGCPGSIHHQVGEILCAWVDVRPVVVIFLPRREQRTGGVGRIPWLPAGRIGVQVTEEELLERYPPVPAAE